MIEGLGSLLGDRARRVVLPILVLLLAGDVTAWWVWRAQTPPSFVRCLEAPEGRQPCLGEELVLPLQVVQAIEGPERFRVGRLEGSIAVLGDATELRVGEEITVGGQRTEEGLRASFIQTHPLRPWKRRLGAIGAGIAGLLLLLVFTLRRTPSGLRVVPRRRSPEEA